MIPDIPLQIIRLDKSVVPTVWPSVAPLVNVALQYGGNTSLAHVYRDIVSDAKQLWVAVDIDGFQAVMVTQLYYEPDGTKVLQISYLAGEDFDLLYSQGMALVEGFALDEGCEIIRFRGRRGWVKVLKKHGYEETQVICEKRIIPKTVN